MIGPEPRDSRHRDSELSGDLLAEPPAHPPIEPSEPEPRPALTALTLGQFLDWAATVPSGNVDVIRQQIAAADDPELARALTQELGRRPIQDIGLHLMLLSTIGELRDERLEEPLVAFIWEAGPLFDRPEPAESGHRDRDSGGDARSTLDFDAVVQARAVEMLSHLGTESADRATLQVASQHRSPAVRIAAIDAHMFNHGDSDATAEQLRSVIRPEDAKMVGLPRFQRDMDPAHFDAGVQRFYERNPEERPSSPEHTAEPPSGRRWGRDDEGQED